MGAKPEGDTFLPGGDTKAFVLLLPQLLHDTKSIFCHQVYFFNFFYLLKSVITNLR